MPAVDFFQCIRNFSYGGPCARGINCQRHQVTILFFSCPGQGFQSLRADFFITGTAQFLQAPDLGIADSRVVDIQDVDRGFFG